MYNIKMTHDRNNKPDKIKKKDNKTVWIFLTILFLLCLVILRVQLWRTEKPRYDDINLTAFHTGDAKLAANGYLATSQESELELINTKTGKITKTGKNASWIDALLEENVLVVSDRDDQTTIYHFDTETGAIVSQKLIIDDGSLHIDPSIVKKDNMYYLTSTRIEGTVNRSDPNEENGRYYIELYSSPDLEHWTYEHEILTRDYNLEDVELNCDDGVLRLIFEQETVDKGPSSIRSIESTDNGASWGNERILIPQNADNEPASFAFTGEEYWLFYSSDYKNPGTSYEGASGYLTRYDKNMNLLSTTELSTKYRDQVLLYQAIVVNGTASVLYAHDYLNSNDLCLENIGFTQLQTYMNN